MIFWDQRWDSWKTTWWAIGESSIRSLLPFFLHRQRVNGGGGREGRRGRRGGVKPSGHGQTTPKSRKKRAIWRTDPPLPPSTEKKKRLPAVSANINIIYIRCEPGAIWWIMGCLEIAMHCFCEQFSFGLFDMSGVYPHCHCPFMRFDRK